MKRDQILEEMLAYIQGKLSDENKLKIKEKIEKNEMYALAFEQLTTGLKSEPQTIEKIKKWGPIFSKELKQEIAKNTNLNFSIPLWKDYKYAIPAAVMLIALIFIWNQRSTFTEVNPAEIAQVLIKSNPYQETLSTQSGSTDSVTLQKNKILRLYNIGSPVGYKKALPLIDTYLNSADSLGYRERIELQLCYAYILLFQEQSKDALELLNELENDLDSHFHDEILWYNILGYLKQGNTSKSIELAKRLKKNGGKHFKQKAQELLDQL